MESSHVPSTSRFSGALWLAYDNGHLVIQSSSKPVSVRNSGEEGHLAERRHRRFVVPSQLDAASGRLQAHHFPDTVDLVLLTSFGLTHWVRLSNRD